MRASEEETMSVQQQMVDDAEGWAAKHERECLVEWLRAGCGTGDAHAVRSPSVIADLEYR
jgi:hypothetical protein